MERQEITRIGEVDRTEHVTMGYTVRDGKLESRTMDWHISRWPSNGERGVPERIRKLQALVNDGGVVFGAFDGAELAGFAAVRYGVTETMAQLYYLFVGNGYRRRGIGTQLFAEACRLARASGAQALYISATPSESAVGFYRRQGAKVAKEVHPELYALEPEDIHMVRPL